MGSPVKARLYAHPHRSPDQVNSVDPGQGIPTTDSQLQNFLTNPFGKHDPKNTPQWHPALLTWYDPALGGTNSGSGAKNPHAKTASGEPYDATKDTCAAPASFKFGDIITFAYGPKKVTCKVNDRGGAITGSHFDLSRSAATKLGIISKGSVHGSYLVVSGAHSDLTGSNFFDPGAVDPSIPDPLKGLAARILSLLYPSTWIRLGKILLGAILLLIGLNYFLKSAFGVQPHKSIGLKLARLAK